jgi:hypothetical protein
MRWGAPGWKALETSNPPRAQRVADEPVSVSPAANAGIDRKVSGSRRDTWIRIIDVAVDGLVASRARAANLLEYASITWFPGAIIAINHCNADLIESEPLICDQSVDVLDAVQLP